MNKLRLEGRFAHLKPARLLLFVIAVLAGWLYPASLMAAATINYVQGNSAVPQTSQTTVNVTFTAAQAAGDLNVVVVGWNDTTATVSSVADKSGNTYTLAVGPTAFTGVLSQSIYYAKNIKSAAAAANIVTVTFSPAAAYPDIRILEYNGADLNSPVDVTAANTGNSSTTNSGSATTTNATDLLLGASMVATFTTGPGTGFTSRLLTSPDGDIAEDRMVTATGSYSATTAALSPAGPWVMQMVAFRTPLGSVAPPTAPGNLTATAASTSQLNLSWTASTSTIGIANYVVQRCQGAGCTNFAQIATPTGTTYSSTGLLASATYSYRVQAVDTAGTPSTFSNTANATTLTDTTPPTAPSNLTGPGPIVQAGQSYINATAQTTHTTAPFDSSGGDVIVVCASSHAGVTMTPSDSFNNTWASAAGPTSTSVGADLRTQVWYAKSPTVGPGHTFTLNLSALQPLVISVFVVKGSNVSAPINTISTIGDDAGTQTLSVTSPNITTTSNNDLLIGFAKPATNEIWTPGNGFTAQSAATSPYLGAETKLAVTFGTYNATFTINTSTTWQAVVVAVNLPLTVASISQINLSWTASTDDVGVTGYLVERCQGVGCANFTQIATTPGPNFIDTGLTASTVYSYRVRATDAAGNLSAYSNTISASTQASPDTTPPTAPSNLIAAPASSSQINLSWTASTDNVGVTGYLVERCQGSGCTTFAQIATPIGTAYNDTGLASSTSYSYRVRATDAAGNLSTYSGTATASTQAPQPPTAPSNLTATAASTSQINLSWTASTSTIGIANYVVQRCQGAGCTNFAQIAITALRLTYSDTGLLSNTSYSYRVQAIDTAGTRSAFSNTATATTLTPQPPTAPSNLTATAASVSQINLSWTASTSNVGLANYI